MSTTRQGKAMHIILAWCDFIAVNFKGEPLMGEYSWADTCDWTGWDLTDVDVEADVELAPESERERHKGVYAVTPPSMVIFHNGRKTRKCDACGMTEDYHENELGMGPLVEVDIGVAPGEALFNYTGEDEDPRPARVCNEHFIEWLDAQPMWLQEMFARINPAHYRL